MICTGRASGDGVVNRTTRKFIRLQRRWALEYGKNVFDRSGTMALTIVLLFAAGALLWRMFRRGAATPSAEDTPLGEPRFPDGPPRFNG